jgi:hypothetical protein
MEPLARISTKDVMSTFGILKGRWRIKNWHLATRDGSYKSSMEDMLYTSQHVT